MSTALPVGHWFSTQGAVAFGKAIAILASCASGRCELGEAVLAFRGGNVPTKPPGYDAPTTQTMEAANSWQCEPWQPECWHQGIVADGGGRGDAYVTVLWNDKAFTNRRLHGSYARKKATGEACALPDMISETSACADASCFKYFDSCKDRVGGVIGTSAAVGDCRILAEKRLCKAVLASGRLGAAICPQSCGVCTSSSRPRRCVSLLSLLPRFQSFAHWGWYSQWNQDSVLHILLVHPDGLWTPAESRFFVEFGYRPEEGMMGFHSNSEYLRRIGWRGVAFDELHHRPDMGVFKEVITAENVVDVFKRQQVPREPGIVMIDIDSCDLWVFLSLTRIFRPRVVQIEYNRHFPFDANVTLDCRNGAPPLSQQLAKTDLYGASIQAIAFAAKLRGYTVAWIERCFDIFLVRADLVCPGSRLPDLEMFRSFTVHDGCTDPWGWLAAPAPAPDKRRWLLDVGKHGLESRAEYNVKN